MAGLIKREDIDEVRNRTDLREVVESYVTLKSAGIGSYKGLCPFHDERSPSFHIRPQLGTFHCFGCGESGDVIAFIQKMDHSSFTETVELLAARINYELHYEDGGPGRAAKTMASASAWSMPTRWPRSSSAPSWPPTKGPPDASSWPAAASTRK